MMSTTTDLAAWLLERIAEDEAVARAANLSRAPHYPEGMSPTIVRHSAGAGSTSRVVATCAAMRAIVKLASGLAEHDDLGSSTRDDGEAILRALASVYVDHDGYQESWA